MGSHPVGGGADLPRWGEAMAVSTPPWTTTRKVLFQKSRLVRSLPHA
jgi:hypothetical protein